MTCLALVPPGQRMARSLRKWANVLFILVDHLYYFSTAFVNFINVSQSSINSLKTIRSRATPTGSMAVSSSALASLVAGRAELQPNSRHSKTIRNLEATSIGITTLPSRRSKMRPGALFQRISGRQTLVLTCPTSEFIEPMSWIFIHFIRPLKVSSRSTLWCGKEYRTVPRSQKTRREQARLRRIVASLLPVIKVAW